MGHQTLTQLRETWRLQFEPQLALPVPHEAAGEARGGRGAGDAGERPGVDADARKLLLQRGQVAVVHDAKHVQQRESGEHGAQVREGSEVDVVAAAQREMEQTLQLPEHREAVGHQGRAVT